MQIIKIQSITDLTNVLLVSENTGGTGGCPFWGSPGLLFIIRFPAGSGGSWENCGWGLPLRLENEIITIVTLYCIEPQSPSLSLHHCIYTKCRNWGRFSVSISWKCRNLGGVHENHITKVRVLTCILPPPTIGMFFYEVSARHEVWGTNHSTKSSGSGQNSD